MPDLLQASQVCTFYNKSQALFDASVAIPQRGGVAVLGRNGVGKTTLLKTLAGELVPKRGTISLRGQDITRLATEKRVRRGLGYVASEGNVFVGLTVRENLALGAVRTRDPQDKIDEMLQLFPRLAQRMNQKAGTLSGGERKMLAISRALLGDPDLVMLDEPTEGVWHGVIEEIAERLRDLTQKLAVLIVEQHVELALRVAQYCYVMDRGTVALEGPSAEVRQNPMFERLLAP